MARSRLSVPTDLTQADAYELSALYNAKSVSPVEVTRAVLARAEKLQPQFNAYRHLVHPEIAQAVTNAVRVFTEQGATVVEVERVIEDPTPILTALAAERAARLVREIGPKGLELVDQSIRTSVENAQGISIANLVEAQERRAALAVQLRKFHQQYDLLVTPVQSQPVSKRGTAPQAPFLSAFNLTQQPAASVPIGFDSNGLPIGLQIVGPSLDDAAVLRAARAFELIKPFARITG